MMGVEHHGDVVVVDFGDGENRLNRTSVDAINAALDDVTAAKGPVALVTTAQGKHYCNGLDLDWMMEAVDEEPDFLDDVHALLLRILLLDVTTVAAVNGHAYAAGAMLASAHDYTIMRSDRGYWCLPEVDLGLPITAEMFTVLEAHLPPATLAEASLTGRRYDAREALEAGIVDKVSGMDDLVTDAVGIAQPLAAKNRHVIAAHKRLLHRLVLDLHPS